MMSSHPLICERSRKGGYDGQKKWEMGASINGCMAKLDFRGRKRGPTNVCTCPCVDYV